MPANVFVAVVDDDESARDAIVELVRALGYEARGFASASEFLLSGDKQSVVCLVTDMRMPHMSGFQLHGELAATGLRIPTILVSAHEDDLTRIREMHTGIHFCLSKPLDPEKLLDCLRLATGARG